ncbi:MAG: hypothetical protein ACQESN_10250 [Thermotogota bacterium]
MKKILIIILIVVALMLNITVFAEENKNDEKINNLDSYKISDSVY